MKYFLLSMLLILGPLSHAGKGSGGGDAVLLDGKLTLLDLAEQDEITPFYARISRYDESVSGPLVGYFSKGTNNSWWIIGDEILGNSHFTYAYLTLIGLDFERCKTQQCNSHNARFSNPAFQLTDEFQSYFDHTDFVAQKEIKWFFTNRALEEVDDEGIIRLPNPVSKRQVAVQKDFMVVINEDEFRSLDPRSQAALFVHEIVLAVVLQLNPELIEEKGTEPIRRFVRRMLRYFDGRSGKLEAVPHDWVLEAFRELGIPKG